MLECKHPYTGNLSLLTGYFLSFCKQQLVFIFDRFFPLRETECCVGVKVIRAELLKHKGNGIALYKLYFNPSFLFRLMTLKSVASTCMISDS